MNWIKKNIKNFLLLLLGCILAFSLLEGYLKIFTPIKFRVKGDKIILPINEKYIFKNKKSEKLDKIVIHTKNSLGFRGEELPKNFENYLSIICVGGSTTEDSWLSDNKTWCSILSANLKNDFNNIWLNNAGFSGHSTFGHTILVNDYISKLKPKVVLFLVGFNDIGREEFIEKEEICFKGLYFDSIKGFLKSIANYSDVFALFLNFYRYEKARMLGVENGYIDLRKSESVELSEEFKNKIKNEHKEKYLKSYEIRLKKLIETTKRNNIRPVLITEPVLYGNAIDDITNVDLSKIKIKDGNGELFGEIMELYNDITRQVGRDQKVFVIDLAKEMPKSSKYYYDFIHFSNEGATKAAEIIYKYLKIFLAEEYGEYLR